MSSGFCAESADSRSAIFAQKSNPEEYAKKKVREFLSFPTKNPFFNLGITSTVLFFLVYWTSKREYLSYWVSIVYTAIFLFLLVIIMPKEINE